MQFIAAITNVSTFLFRYGDDRAIAATRVAVTIANERLRSLFSAGTLDCLLQQEPALLARLQHVKGDGQAMLRAGPCRQIYGPVRCRPLPRRVAMSARVTVAPLWTRLPGTESW